MTETPQSVPAEINATAAATRELLAETRGELGSALDKARHARHSAFVNLRRAGRAIGQQTGDSARIAARAMRHHVRNSPWRALGVAVVVGVALAYLLRRR